MSVEVVSSVEGQPETIAETVEVEKGTRDHKGTFVPDEVYQLVETTPSGWALICPDNDNSVCHYVDPESIQEAPERCFL